VFLLREGISKKAEKVVQQVLQGQGQIDQVQGNAATCRISVT
jgi:hypothetical protein